MIGSSKLALEMGITPAYIAIGAAAGLHRYLKETEGVEQTLPHAAAVLAVHCELPADGELAKMILGMYQRILDGATLQELRRAADAIIAEKLTNVI